MNEIIPSGDIMMSLYPTYISRELWSWLNLTFEKSTSAQRTFHNIDEFNRAEVYRQLVIPLGITKASIIRRNIIRDRVQTPNRVKSMLSVMDTIAKWESSKLAFLKAGGAPHGDEDERAQLYKILPSNISQDMLSHAHDCPTAAAFIEWMREEVLFLSDHGGKDGGVHLADGTPPPPLHAEVLGQTSRRQDHYDYDDDDDDMTEEEVAQMSDAELSAFVRKGGGFTGGKRNGKGKRKGKGKKGDPPPRGRDLSLHQLRRLWSYLARLPQARVP